MITGRRRVAAIVVAFALVLALGVAWLVRTAMADSTVKASADAGRDASTPTSDAVDGARPGGGKTPSAGPGSGTGGASGHSSSRPGTGSHPDGGAGEETISPGSAVPPPPAQTISVSGPLGGGPMDDSCRFLINPFQLTLTVRSVSLVSTDPDLYLDHAHCPAGGSNSVIYDFKPCQLGATVAAGKACYAGVALPADERWSGSGAFQSHAAQVRLGFTATCVSAEVTPCSQDIVAQHEPSQANPVTIEWMATSDHPLVALGKWAVPPASGQPTGPANSSAAASPSP